MVWVCEWTKPGDCDANSTIWSTKDEALAYACSRLLDDIYGFWDVTNTYTKDRAGLISDECAAFNFTAAIHLYNDHEFNQNSKYAQAYRVYERVIGTIKDVPTLRLLNIPAAPIKIQVPNFNITGKAWGSPIPAAPTPFKATKPGATCRGPCQQVSTDAYADRPDGTFCCYQCKLMSQAFGKPVQ